MNEANRSITIANDQTLTDLIGSAQRRIVAMAPAFSQAVAQAIQERWNVLGPDSVSVILDVDPEVYRLGFGDVEALDLLESTAAQLGTTLNRQDGIRIGLIIADDVTVVYSPTPQLVEAGPEKPSTPNAVVIGQPPEDVVRELGQGPNGLRDQTVGLDKAERVKIASVKQDLHRNPPQRFDIARTIRVFNAHFEFVEFSLKHTALHKSSVSLPKEITKLTGDTQLDDLMQHSIELIRDDPSITGKSLEWLRTRIAHKYLITLPGYGTVVLRRLKGEFEKQVERLRRCVDVFCKRVNERIAKATDRTRDRLVERILPQVAKSPPEAWHKYLGPSPSQDDVRHMLDAELRSVFEKKLTRVQSMHVKCLFKGVTYEMLQDEKFLAMARRKLPGLKELHREFDAARTAEKEATNLFKT